MSFHRLINQSQIGDTCGDTPGDGERGPLAATTCGGSPCCFCLLNMKTAFHNVLDRVDYRAPQRTARSQEVVVVFSAPGGFYSIRVCLVGEVASWGQDTYQCGVGSCKASYVSSR